MPLIIGGSGSGKTTVLLNLIKHQRPDIEKTYLYVKDTLKTKSQMLVSRREKAITENFKIPTVFIDYSRQNDDVYENLEDYNLTKKRRENINDIDDNASDGESFIYKTKMVGSTPEKPRNEGDANRPPVPTLNVEVIVSLK